MNNPSAGKPGWNIGTRLGGVVQAVGSAAGLVSIGAATSVTGPVGVAIAVGSGFKLIDSFITGLKTAITGEGQDSYTSQLLQQAGVPPAIANIIDVTLDVASGVGAVKTVVGGATRDAKIIYDAGVGRYRDVGTGRFVAQSKLPYPTNNGFAWKERATLEPGTIVDRFGSADGRFAGRPGTTVSARGLPQGSDALPHAEYRVMKPFGAEVGPAAPVPEFNAVGGGTQYRFDSSIAELVEAGFLEQIR